MAVLCLLNSNDRHKEYEAKPNNTESTARKPTSREAGDETKKDNPMQHQYTIYTDGACVRNPGGPGGWACVILDGGSQILRLRGGELSTTNNRMEILAAIKGLRATPAGSSVLVISDSKYLVNGANTWVHSWVRKGLRNKKNPDLWREIHRLVTARKCVFQWVRGHCGNPLNELCDQMAETSAREQSEAPRSHLTQLLDIEADDVIRVAF